MLLKSTQFVTFLLILIQENINCYKILAIFPMPMYSHYKIASTLLKKLAESDHYVTVINPYPKNQSIRNYQDISVESIIPAINRHKDKLYTLQNKWYLNCFRFLTDMGYEMTEKSLQHPSVQDLLKTNRTKFDVVISAQFMNEAHMAIAKYYEVPLVLLATMPLFPWTNFYLANPTPPSYVPSLLGNLSGQMNYWERVQNFFHTLIAVCYYQLFVLPKHQKLITHYISPHIKLQDALNNVNLVLVNSHESIYDAIPFSPHVIPVGGLHIHPKPNVTNISHELRVQMDNAHEGIIIFSMGSNLKSTDLHEEYLKVIVRVFSKLRQTIIWKWEAEPFNVPGNIHLIKWLPLRHVLAHAQVKLFISHGGLLSTMESIYSGVPILGIPVFTDQKMNIATAVSKGYALRIYLNEFSQEKLQWALDELLNNSSYKRKAENLSKIMRDRPIEPLDLAKYWVEYVIRHKGAHHLKHCGTQLYWFQRQSLDIIGFIVLFCIVLRIIYNQIKKKYIKLKRD